MPEGVPIPIPTPGDGGPLKVTAPYIPTPPGPPVTEPNPPITEPPVTPEPPIYVPPGEPHVPEAMPEPFSLGGWLLVLGLIAAAAAIADLFNFLTSILWKLIRPGRAAPTATTAQVLQPLSNRLGTWLAGDGTPENPGIDGYMGLSFTKLAQLVGQAAFAIAGSEQSALNVAKALQTVRTGQHAQGQEQARAKIATEAAQKQADHASAQAKAAVAAAKAREDNLHDRITALTTHITTVIEPELDGLRHKVPALERGATVAWDEIKKHEEALGITGITALTATALERLGANWIRCEATKELGQAACRSGPNNISNLLKGLLDIAALFDLCMIVTLLVDAAESNAVQDVFSTLTAGIDDLIQCRGIALASPLPAAGYAALAPPMTYAALAPVG